MEILNNIFLIIFLISFVAFIIGMIKPAILKISSRMKVAKVTLSALVISFVLFGVTQTDEQKAKLEAEKKAQEKLEIAEQNKKEEKALEKLKQEEKVKHEARLEAEAEQNKKEQGFGLTLDQFKVNFNTNVEKLGSNASGMGIKKLSALTVINNDGVKQFSTKITDQLELSGDLTDKGYVSAVAILIDPRKGSSIEVVKKFQGYATVVVHTIDPQNTTSLTTLLQVMQDFSESKGDTPIRGSSDNLDFLLTPIDGDLLLIIVGNKNK